MTTQTRKYFLIIGGALLLLLTAGFIWASLRFKPMLRERLVTAIREQYKREVEINDLRISLLPFSAVGEGFVCCFDGVSQCLESVPLASSSICHRSG